MRRVHYTAVFTGLVFLSFNMCSKPANNLASTQQQGISETSVINYQPHLPPGPAYKGTCFTRSLALPRPDAYRCITQQNVASEGGANLFDPCFVLPGAKDRLECDPDPVKGTPGIQLELTQPLPSEPFEKAGPGNAWMVELEDGTICEINTGATFMVNNERASYGCTDGSWLFGDLYPGKVWTALQGTVKGNPPDVQFEKHSTATIRTVWR